MSPSSVRAAVAVPSGGGAAGLAPNLPGGNGVAGASTEEMAALREELSHYQHWTQQMIAVMTAAARGALEARVLRCDQSGQLGQLAHSLNHLLDMTDAFLREAGAALEYASNGKFFRRVILRGMRGTFRHKSELINAATIRLAANSSSLKEVERLVCESSTVAEGAVKEAATTSGLMKELMTASNKIGGVVKAISEVAWQTKLLAFNATIEAARAGTAGAGFQVVAQEVKGLAQQSATAAEEIAKEIGTMRKEVAQAGKAIETMSQTIAKMEEIATTIRRAVLNQNARTD
jgi:methyl-accepting chemotaxis protein